MSKHAHAQLHSNFQMKKHRNSEHYMAEFVIGISTHSSKSLLFQVPCMHFSELRKMPVSKDGTATTCRGAGGGGGGAGQGEDTCRCVCSCMHMQQKLCFKVCFFPEHNPCSVQGCLVDLDIILRSVTDMA